MDDAEARLRRKFEAQQFMERMRRDHPEHAQYYCEHAVYIGFTGASRNKCRECND